MVAYFLAAFRVASPCQLQPTCSKHVKVDINEVVMRNLMWFGRTQNKP